MCAQAKPHLFSSTRNLSMPSRRNVSKKGTRERFRGSSKLQKQKRTKYRYAQMTAFTMVNIGNERVPYSFRRCAAHIRIPFSTLAEIKVEVCELISQVCISGDQRVFYFTIREPTTTKIQLCRQKKSMEGH